MPSKNRIKSIKKIVRKNLSNSFFSFSRYVKTNEAYESWEIVDIFLTNQGTNVVVCPNAILIYFRPGPTQSYTSQVV